MWSWVGLKCLLFISFLEHSHTQNVTSGKLGVFYNGIVGKGNERSYFFNVSAVPKSSSIRISVNTTSPLDSKDSPLLFVVRMLNGVKSWTVPMITTTGEKYYHVTKTLCYALLHPKDSFYLDVSTIGQENIPYSLKVFTDSRFMLQNAGPQSRIEVITNPAEPRFFEYNFQEGEEAVLVKAVSNSDTCAVLIVQDTECPALSQLGKELKGVFSTMTRKSAITVKRSSVEKRFFVTILVMETDTDCEFSNGKINPFSPAKPDDLEAFTDDVKSSLIYRSKTVNLSVEKMLKVKDYVLPVMVPVILFGSFYAVTLLFFIVSWCMSDTGGRSFYRYLFPPKVKEEQEDEQRQGDRLLQEPTHQQYGSNDDIVDGDGNTGINRTPTGSIDDYDRLTDIDGEKDVYRSKVKLFVADLSKKSYKKLSKKFNVYYWNLLTVSVFYALPVIQLVLTYQHVVNMSGDQDICYYNFFCAKPYHLVSAFNNIYSNIGYMLLGILFIFFVMRRDRITSLKRQKDHTSVEKYGIPKHYGIMYAMGYALFMEGVMSACYHVCPNYSNFQFDTAFMYIIGLLGCLRLYQQRHHDVLVNAHYAYTGFAAVIFTSVIGVVFRSRTFWIMFLILHIAGCLYISCQIYYMGRVTQAVRVHWFTNRYLCLSKPLYKTRFGCLIVFNLINLGLSITGVAKVPDDFATYLLAIIIVNGLLYVMFYLIMKRVNGEKLTCFPLFFMVLSICTWAVAIYFFKQSLTNWQTSPAQSREGNRDCALLDFYDDHDLWHFLSAMALFFTFLTVLTVDDGVDNKERTDIVVF